MGRVKGLGHIGIVSKDMKKSIEFYKENLGFVFGKEDVIKTPEGDTKLVLMSVGKCMIELIQTPNGVSESEVKTQLVDHLCLEVEDIEGVYEDLKNKGIEFETEDVVSLEVFGGIKNIFFKGPFGERLELVEN